MIERPPKIEYDADGDYVAIGGMKFAMGLFDWLAHGGIGSAGRIVARADGVVTLETIPPEKD